MRQISQLKHDGPELLGLWEQSVALADCVFLYVYKCTREGPQALNALASWVPVITDIAAQGVRSVDAHVCQGPCAPASHVCAGWDRNTCCDARRAGGRTPSRR
jgi:hypothetical protein